MNGVVDPSPVTVRWLFGAIILVLFVIVTVARWRRYRR